MELQMLCLVVLQNHTLKSKTELQYSATYELQQHKSLLLGLLL